MRALSQLSALLLFSVLLYQPVIAQEKSKLKFGKVGADDFKLSYPLDSNAAAIVIADIGSTDVIGNTNGNFSLEFKKYRRAQILNKNGYDIADVEIRLYTSNKGDLEESLEGLKAVTYNLEDGKVVATKLDLKSAVFKDKISKNLVLRKFTFPNIKEGSIIEYEYRVRSDFMFNLQSWDFQGGYPRLWSEYNVRMPEFYQYVTLFQGYQPYYINTQSETSKSFRISQSSGATQRDQTTFDARVTDYRWVMKDVPALKEEPYTSTLNNHIARLRFQLSELRAPFTPQNVMGSWTKVSSELLDNRDFGYSLSRDNGWLNEITTLSAGSTTDELAKAKNIYAYVRDNFSCVNYSRTFLEKPLRDVLKDHSGSVAEINLLLTAILRKANITADPVVMSTRSNGLTYAMYPLIDRFNYVVVQVVANGTTYYLDASRPLLGFGHLPADCYNGHARVINKEATPLEFLPSSLVERERTIVNIIPQGTGGAKGYIQKTAGDLQSLRIRRRVKEEGKGWLLENFRNAMGQLGDVGELHIDSLDNYDRDLTLRCTLALRPLQEDLVYFNPMMGEGWKENPFKAAKRLYPVEMPTAIDEGFYLNLAVPEGYAVEELPKQMVVKLNEQNEGIFEYRIAAADGRISLRSRVQIGRTEFLPAEYETLREFFDLVVKKHAEQIVLKKIK